MTTLALNYRAINNKIKSATMPKINWKLFYAVSVGSAFLMLVFYIYAINTLTGGSYVIKNYNKELVKLEQENVALQASVASSGFMGSVQERARELNFEKTTQVTYIEVIGNSLAKAQ